MLGDNVRRGADGKGGACSFSEFGSYILGAMVVSAKGGLREAWQHHGRTPEYWVFQEIGLFVQKRQTIWAERIILLYNHSTLDKVG